MKNHVNEKAIPRDGFFIYYNTPLVLGISPILTLFNFAFYRTFCMNDQIIFSIPLTTNMWSNAVTNSHQKNWIFNLLSVVQKTTMTQSELQAIQQGGEGYKVEFKRSLNSDLPKELIAFANSSGGKIFIGIEDDGNISGVQISNELKSKVQSIARDCDPAVPIELEAFNNILVVHVPEGKEKPYRCTNGFYVRDGASSVKLSTQEIIDFIKIEGRVRFEDLLASSINYQVEISNPGGLPKGLKPENFGKHSLARNPLVTGLLHRCNYIEKAGTGIQRMRDGMKAVGLPEPIFDFSNFFTVIFKRKTLINVPWAAELNVQPNKLRRIIGILQTLLNGNKLDVEEVARQFHTSGRNIRKDLELLQEKNWVLGSGNTKNKTYQLTETGKQMAIKIRN